MIENRRFFLGGLPFEVGPCENLTTPETEYIEYAGSSNGGESREEAPPPFRIELQGPKIRNVGVRRTNKQFLPTAVRWTGTRIELSHALYDSVLDLDGNVARLSRDLEAKAALAVTLRVSLRSRLPLCHGVPLHAAAVVIGGQAILFCGPSGAGKSTLTALSPFPALSDEMIAIVGPSFHVFGAGHWGTMGHRPFPRGGFPLAAIVELRRGESFHLEVVSPSLAIRRLAGVLLVPAVPALWSNALSVLGRLSRAVPMYSMLWTPDCIRWDELVERISLSA